MDLYCSRSEHGLDVSTSRKYQPGTWSEKEHCKKVTEKTISGILVFAIFCTLGRFLEMVSLVAMTVLLVLISQCIGVLKFKIEKNVYSREW